jgi:hypothetical protein
MTARLPMESSWIPRRIFTVPAPITGSMGVLLPVQEMFSSCRSDPKTTLITLFMVKRAALRSLLVIASVFPLAL